MKKTIFPWLDREFVSLSCEGNSVGTATEETEDIFRRFEEELNGEGLTLENTVRTRLWGRDRASRDRGSDQRVKILSGKSRSVSSSYIAPGYFESGARVSLDLVAMRTVASDAQKFLKEYDPPITPLRYLTYDSVVYLSGVTSEIPGLREQLDDILPRIQGSLTDAGSSWENVVKVSFYLHRSQKHESLKEMFEETIKINIPQVEYSFVDGYSSPGKLIEIEVTAQPPVAP